MPSYRVTLAIGTVEVGIAADGVLPAVEDAVRKLAVVEAADLQVARGGAQIVVRFTADDQERAVQIAQHVASATARLASVESWRVMKREGARWVSL